MKIFFDPHVYPEYSYWFDYYMLPGLEISNIPIPLGKTSNHFKLQNLMELGGWDPFNVTEDADLCTGLCKGYKVSHHQFNHLRGSYINEVV